MKNDNINHFFLKFWNKKGALKRIKPHMCCVIVGFDDDFIGKKEQRICPDVLFVHICIVNIDHTVFIKINRRGKARFKW